jgi:S-formylglutathione hydrolase
MKLVKANRSFGGTQSVYIHRSRETGTDMVFSVYLPPQVSSGLQPAIWYLSGLTCTHANVTEKAGFQRVCAKHGLILIAPDTSPRGEDVPGDAKGSFDFGIGASYYLDATKEPYRNRYRMYSYITNELPELLKANFPIDPARQSIMGHSMGGHGALIIALKNPRRFRSVSAFAPISSLMSCPWGQKALTGYLGPDTAGWRDFDSIALMEDGHRMDELLVDQGTADEFLKTQLKPELLKTACKRAKIDLKLRMQRGYDHSYYFVASFIEDHLHWHRERLTA